VQKGDELYAAPDRDHVRVAAAIGRPVSGGAAMREEWFPTQARLLGSTRTDGWVASARDTGNSFKYKAGVGWTQYLPFGGIEGQPLVAAASGSVTYESVNRLVPAGGVPGELLGVNQDADTAFVARDAVGALAYPVDFSSGSATTVFSRDYIGGEVGPHGFVRITIFSLVQTSASRTVTFSVLSPVLGSNITNLDTPAMVSSVKWYGLDYEFLFNWRDDTTGVFRIKLVTTRYDIAGSGTVSEISDLNNRIYSAGLDSTAPWTLTIQATTNGVTDTAAAQTALDEHAYIL
jgi:hypothetical protein